MKKKLSEQLVGHDDKSNIFNYKFSFAVTIPKICKDDIVVVNK